MPPYVFEHRTDIQGMRGLAVLLVVLYHTGLPVTGGFIGVDVFFVISGFVISGGILKTLGTDRFSMSQFYRRRLRRLLPALSLTLTLVVLASTFLAPERALDATGKTAISATLLNANHYLFQATGYFDSPAEFNPLLHTWSLSVEEQFYLFFPVLIFGLWRAAKRHESNPYSKLAGGVALIGLASFSLNLGMVELPGFMGIDTRSLAFYTCVTRVWEFSVGALLAVLLPRLRGVTAKLDSLGFIGFAAILAAAVLFSKETVFPGYAALLPVLGTALLIVPGAVRDERSNFKRLFETRWLVRVGDLSYAWYLWHWPAIVFARATWPNDPTATGIAVILSLGAAWLTERWVETPIRKRPRAEQRPILVVGLVCVLLPVLAVFIQNEVSRSLDLPILQAMRHAKTDYAKTGCATASSLATVGNQCAWGKGPTRVIVVGDSNAQQHLPAFKELANSGDFTIKATTMLGCPFVDLKTSRDGLEHRRCRRWVQEIRSELLAAKPDIVVIGIATDAYITGTNIGIEDANDLEAKRAVLVEGLRGLVRELSDAGIRVLLLDPIPKFQPNPDSATNHVVLGDSCSAAALYFWPEKCAPQRRLDDPFWLDPTIGKKIHAEAVDSAQAHVDFAPALCPNGQCRVFDGQHWLYRDDAHLSPRGSRLTTELLRTRLGVRR